MTLIISVIIGAALGALICYAVDLPCSPARILSVCLLGALLGGWAIPMLLAISGFWSALIGSVIGAALLFRLHQYATHTPNYNPGS